MKAIVDCNCFYAACERLFQPSLHGKPVVVLSNNDGCIVSRSDEAKALGIKMAGPYYQHKKEIEENNIAVFSSNYYLYGDMSWRVMETLRRHSPHVEVYSVDESFLDLTGIAENKLLEYSFFLKQTTEMWTGIPVSIGVAPTKVLSKVANKLAKKDKAGTKGVMILHTPEQQKKALQNIAIEEIWGVGSASAKKLRMHNINTGWDLRNMGAGWARKNLGGVVGVRLIKELRGESCIEMKTALETKKIIGTSRMFGKPVYELKEIKEAVATYVTRVAEKLRRQKSAATTITVFLVTNNYSNAYEYKPARSSLYSILLFATSATNLLIAHAMPLVEGLYKEGNKYIKAGVIVNDIVPEDAIQFNLFAKVVHSNEKVLMETIDNINFGIRNDLLKFASLGTKTGWNMRQDKKSQLYTTRWEELVNVR